MFEDMFTRFGRTTEYTKVTNRQTDRHHARRHRPRLCVVPRGKNAEKCSELFITMSLTSLIDDTHKFVLVYKLCRYVGLRISSQHSRHDV